MLVVKSRNTHLSVATVCTCASQVLGLCRGQSPREPREETSKQGLPNTVKSYQEIRVFEPEADIGNFYEDLQWSDGCPGQSE